MISKDEVMPMLMIACPSYRARWQDYSADSTYEPGLVHLDLCDFAHHLVDLLREEKTEEFRAVFDVIERMHLEGDEYVREAATIGALEGVQNIAGNRGLDPERFQSFLGRTSKRQWKKLNKFWSGQGHLV